MTAMAKPEYTPAEDLTEVPLGPEPPETHAPSIEERLARLEQQQRLNTARVVEALERLTDLEAQIDAADLDSACDMLHRIHIAERCVRIGKIRAAATGYAQTVAVQQKGEAK